MVNGWFTGIAREATDMVVINDNIATIATAVRLLRAPQFVTVDILGKAKIRARNLYRTAALFERKQH
jgi:hypothetical protein